ncbi:ankyrin repeat domain-containing protein [Flavobacterium cupreum]|uniref:Ankyrin repeat domain-containing protein n=1 Tax=Flavobacterium cupreum TaxID=2133766 RepID=A0A434ADF7_9FLAO|nr:ankyrin repeat domain-containing protein [Flavobacterium cupreum]RUT72400.1 ankyrin repeat domain-containing protein [Flavobacterium cupreum]
MSVEVYRLISKEEIDNFIRFLNKEGIDYVDEDKRSLFMLVIIYISKAQKINNILNSKREVKNNTDFYKKGIELVNILIQYHCNINTQDRYGFSALHYAAQSSYDEFVELLILNNAKVDLQDNEGNTPLWHAAMNSSGITNTIQLLLDAGADINKANKHGVSPKDLIE